MTASKIEDRTVSKEETPLQIINLALGDYQTNCYILFEDHGNEAIVIDPGFEPEKILDRLDKNQLSPRYIVVTHGHGDHIGAIPQLKKAFPAAQVLIHSLDQHRLGDPRSSMIYMMGSRATMEADRCVEENETISLGNIHLKVLLTPGHTEGGISLLSEGCVFTGDTLFQGSVGRTDLPGGNFQDLEKSIREKLYRLPDDTVVYPGHGPQTTIGDEKRFNAFFSENI